MYSKEECIQIYREMRSRLGRPPKLAEYNQQVPRKHLDTHFGSNAFSQLQELCGDPPSRLHLERISIDEIFSQWGNLVISLHRIPSQADWAKHKGKPTCSGLAQTPHFIKWSEVPRMFVQWAKDSHPKWAAAVEIIGEIDSRESDDSSAPVGGTELPSVLKRLLEDLRQWIPAQRRTSEEGYKVELRRFLENARWKVNEEMKKQEIVWQICS